MPFIGLSVIIQLALAAHVVKTGRDRYWIYIILIPGIGAALYPNSDVESQKRVQAIDVHKELAKTKST